MPKYTVVITNSVYKLLRKLPNQTATLLENKMLLLENNPRPHGCIKLQGKEAFRIRVGNYRIIYEIHDQVLKVTVIDIGHRKDIYR